MIVDTNTDFDFTTIIDTATWDWLRASISYTNPDHRTDIMQCIIKFMTENYGDPSTSGCKWNHVQIADNANYEKVIQFYVGTDRLFTVARGREHVGKFILLEATGSRASIGRKLLDRISKIPATDCYVTRSDSAIDLSGDPELFNTITGFFNAFAKDNNISAEPRGYGWHDPTRGRTMYYGSTSSDYFIRIYEKGHEQRDKGVQDADLTWIRIEVQTQYKKRKQRSVVASWNKPSIPFSVGWVHKVMQNILMADIIKTSVPTAYKPQTDTERTILMMFKRSRKALRILAENSQDKEQFLQTILQEIEYDFDT